ncbi:MAG: DUF488 domain-containing protein [Candidatus Thermoplasmatota archaeon]|nr:DUF488 domain-containing protein [Candidatus Thermoplasmatota archaeon]
MLSAKKQQVLQMLSYTGPINRLRFVKLMFLLSRSKPSYDFVPYKYGPFSFELYHDLEGLSQEGLISYDEKIVPLKTQRMIDTPHPSLEEYAQYPDNKLIKYIYKEYPFFTINSEIEKRMVIPKEGHGIFTIGYQGKSIDSFISSLVKNGIRILIDVRNNPFSRKYGFSKSSLSSICQKMEIEYIHIPELGIASKIRTNTDANDWEKMLDSYEEALDSKIQHMDKIIKLGEEKKVVLMCFEKDLSLCHRNRLAKYLSRKGIVCEDI